MSTAIVTGASGLVGSAVVRELAASGLEVHGVDAHLRETFFGAPGSTRAVGRALVAELPNYRAHALDVRDGVGVDALFAQLGTSLTAVVHCAAQPSHEWSLREPAVDFAINAGGTLVVLEALRRHAPEAALVHLSTNKVYGDHPNRLPLEERERRLELAPDHVYAEYGIDESLAVDGGTHTPFGVSKLSADLLVQEAARSYGLATAVLRCGCLVGGEQAATELHGFLGHLVRCAVEGEPYTVFGHGGKQVRDLLHASDLARAIVALLEVLRDDAPREGHGSVYNLGGGRRCHASLLELVARVEQLTNRSVDLRLGGAERLGDHRWWVTDTRRFRRDVPGWAPAHDLDSLLGELVESRAARLAPATL